MKSPLISSRHGADLVAVYSRVYATGVHGAERHREPVSPRPTRHAA